MKKGLDIMQMTGEELIKWIKENELENSHVYMQISENGTVKSVSPKQLEVDECGDILICNSGDLSILSNKK